MGLTVHYTLRHPGPLSPDSAEALVRTAHRRAAALVRRRGLAEIGAVDDVRALDFLARGTVFEKDGDDTYCHDVPVQCGWAFPVWPGQGCETVWLGLGYYPSHIRVGGRRLRTGCGGWTWSSFCKTQYAHLHGPEHFLRCHRAVIDLVLIWQRLGCPVRINDEGDYWPTRDEARVLKEVGFLECAIAGLAGAAKDAADARGGEIQAPIFAHPRFEHIEAEGATLLGDRLQQAGTLIQHLGHVL